MAGKIGLPKVTKAPSAAKMPKSPAAKSASVTNKATPGMGAYMNASKMPKQGGMRGAINKMY